MSKLSAALRYSPDSVEFGGVLGMLDATDRAAPISDVDVGHARWGLGRNSQVQQSFAGHDSARGV
eukprot:6780282-Lingulodinium_polyedra.AAC.1